MPAPIVVPIMTAEVAAQIREMAQTLPYRAYVGVDPDRVVWVEVAGDVLIGVAFSPNEPDGPHWMLAFRRLDGRKVGTSTIRRAAEQIVGTVSGLEVAPPLANDARLTLVRVPAARYPPAPSP